MCLAVALHLSGFIQTLPFLPLSSVFSTEFRDKILGGIPARQEYTQPVLCQAHRQRQSAAMWRKSVTGRSVPPKGDRQK